MFVSRMAHLRNRHLLLVFSVFSSQRSAAVFNTTSEIGPHCEESGTQPLKFARMNTAFDTATTAIDRNRCEERVGQNFRGVPGEEDVRKFYSSKSVCRRACQDDARCEYWVHFAARDVCAGQDSVEGVVGQMPHG